MKFRNQLKQLTQSVRVTVERNWRYDTRDESISCGGLTSGKGSFRSSQLVRSKTCWPLIAYPQFLKNFSCLSRKLISCVPLSAECLKWSRHVEVEGSVCIDFGWQNDLLQIRSKALLGLRLLMINSSFSCYTKSAFPLSMNPVRMPSLQKWLKHSALLNIWRLSRSVVCAFASTLHSSFSTTQVLHGVVDFLQEQTLRSYISISIFRLRTRFSSISSTYRADLMLTKLATTPITLEQIGSRVIWLSS